MSILICLCFSTFRSAKFQVSKVFSPPCRGLQSFAFFSVYKTPPFSKTPCLTTRGCVAAKKKLFTSNIYLIDGAIKSPSNRSC